MENKNWNLSNQTNFESSNTSTTQTFMSKVFAWMFAALAVTSITAFYVAGNESIIRSLLTETGPSILGWIVMLAPIGFVLAMGLGFNKFSYNTLVILFLSYAVIMGVSLSFILLVYTAASIFSTFLITSLMFGGMAVVGYTTKTDLTKFGSLMMMGLWGLIIASVVNFFLKSDTMEYIMSFIGVAVFTGLTAYDVQKLKNIGNGMEYGDESSKKVSIMGALNLYLDFVNLFLFLLRFFGSRRD
jgi:FtsH-binding integral membrane protein